MNLTGFNFLPDFKNKAKSLSKSVICYNELRLILKAEPKSANVFTFRDFLNKLTPPKFTIINFGNESSACNKAMLRTSTQLSHGLRGNPCASAVLAANCER